VPGQPPQIFAVVTATGLQVGAVRIPAKTTALPMTFQHKGKQYIVFEPDAGSSATLTAMAVK